MNPRPLQHSPSAGFSMIEVLVTIVILAFGLLGLAGMLLHIQTAEMESYQRTQAVILVTDMAERIIANRTNDPTATSFASSSTLGKDDSRTSCSGLTAYELDKCEWSLALKGNAEIAGTSKIGAMIDARGCITQLQAATTTGCLPAIYRVDVAWQGLAATGAPAVACGRGSYGTDSNRRAVSRTITIGLPGCT